MQSKSPCLVVPGSLVVVHALKWPASRQHRMLRNGGGSWVPLPLGTLAFCANGHLVPSSPPGASTGCGWQGWVGAQEGCVPACPVLPAAPAAPRLHPPASERRRVGEKAAKNSKGFLFCSCPLCSSGRVLLCLQAEGIQIVSPWRVWVLLRYRKQKTVTREKSTVD